jgi:hypothetical protein
MAFLQREGRRGSRRLSIFWYFKILMGKTPIVAATIGTFNHNVLRPKKFKRLPFIPSSLFFRG